MEQRRLSSFITSPIAKAKNQFIKNKNLPNKKPAVF
jgi:hypothetical protein